MPWIVGWSFQNRIELADLNVWLTSDPIMSGINYYEDCSDNPNNRLDPTGLIWGWDVQPKSILFGDGLDVGGYEDIWGRHARLSYGYIKIDVGGAVASLIGEVSASLTLPVYRLYLPFLPDRDSNNASDKKGLFFSINPATGTILQEESPLYVNHPQEGPLSSVVSLTASIDNTEHRVTINSRILISVGGTVSHGAEMSGSVGNKQGSVGGKASEGLSYGAGGVVSVDKTIILKARCAGPSIQDLAKHIFGIMN
jgi:hypothetical protein